MIPNQQSETFLEALCVNVDPRKARSLRLIYEICEEQHDRGSTDYSIATIGRLSAERGGPAAGAIRNKTGEAYRALITAFAGPAGNRTGRRGSIDTSQVELILEGAGDPVLRARLGLLLAELKATRAQLLAARHIANQTATLDLGQSAGDHAPRGTTPELTELEVRAIRLAISDHTLDHWGWRSDDLGRITTADGQTVFAAGFVTAIMKMLKCLDISSARQRAP